MNKIAGLLFLVTFSLELVNCGLNQNLNVPEQNLQTNTSKTSSEIEVANLCELFNNSYAYHQKIVKLKATLYIIHTDTTFSLVADEKCEQRHPLIDVDFGKNFEPSVCSGSTRLEEELCSILKESPQKNENVTYEIIGVVGGYFEYYQSNEGFTRDGLRFRFTIQNIEKIDKITSAKIQKVIN